MDLVKAYVNEESQDTLQNTTCEAGAHTVIDVTHEGSVQLEMDMVKQVGVKELVRNSESPKVWNSKQLKTQRYRVRLIVQRTP